MKKFRFEIQSLIKVEIEEENVMKARVQLIDNLDLYEYELKNAAIVSEGEEIK